MKKMLSVLLSIVIVCGITSAAVAETDVEKGLLAVNESIRYVFGNGDYDSMFEKGSFTTWISESDKIVVKSVATWKVGDFAQGTQSTAEMISAVWDIFVKVSREFTDAEVYFMVDYEGDTIYLASPEGVYDMRYSKVYDHIEL